jgi:tRNA pseudouridine55 synthase
MKPRPVLIKRIDLLKYEWPFLKIRVVCGPGVYIRSLARDIGEKLGVGGYMAELERIRVGDFKIADAIKL